jgi:predicted small integral membrane protein
MNAYAKGATRAAWLSALLLAAGGAGLAISPKAFFEAWLVAWLFWAGLSLGSLAILMLQSLTGGAWAQAVRLPCEAAVGTLGPAALLFIPILLGAGQIYPWTDRELFLHHEWPHKEAYLSLPYFAIRAAIYFGIFVLLGALLRRWSAPRPGLAEERRALRLRQTSCAGLILYFVSMNFAATDWVVSLTPQWYSTMFSVILMIGQFLSALAFVIVLVCVLGAREPFAGMLTPKHLHDLGNLLLAFVVFWAYVSFAQFLLIWSGNLPREISWYLPRLSGGWQYVALALFLVQFLVPFALLLSREAKRDPRRLGRVAMLVLAANALNTYWLTAPSFAPARFTWLDPVLFAAIGAAWIALFLRNFGSALEVARHG